MKNYAMVILACTKNLGSVTFSYTLDGKTTDFTYTKEQGENEFLGTCNYFRSSATEFQTLLAKTGILSDPVFSRLSGNQGYRLTEQLNNVPDAEITGTIQNEKQNIIKQYESYLPTNSWSPGSINKSFLPKKMHSLISDTKICGHLPSHRKQTAFPSTQPRIKKETSATSRFPNYTVVQTDRSM